MPLCTLHLVRLDSGTTIRGFLIQLLRHASSSEAGQGFRVVTASQVRHPVVLATRLDSTLLNSTMWDLVVLLAPIPSTSTSTSTSAPPPTTFPAALEEQLAAHYTVVTGVPSKLVDGYSETTRRLNAAQSPPLTALGSPPSTTPPSRSTATEKTVSSSQNLELSPTLLDFAYRLRQHLGHAGSVTMLNLMHFHSTPGAMESYHRYGQGFATVGGSKGGNAKIVGVVVPPPAQSSYDSRGDRQRAKQDWWNECSLVHYPSIDHFCDMAADPEYQRINAEHRLGALRDTTLICTTEIDLEALAGDSASSTL
ncbi:uncharacterized protein PFL1_05166 [Pseudozyma flocculosa PF-1]|uniref:EthD domain-containing protein n=2 Tax=Pseudozyma flocculosa TaxID=84751 RepID=A0A5C3F5G2_9BASI|nr:uncharacterized protein PFL1_05166 [Pseudozyma flocculosa PF-1]EPQ27243.1 hypothetical protein PFL1_05166 [Pseudozyma flocculosa PF-1]SPO39612.1 uncharacterized protein PSFLO_05093 [Pseudozyma flocculosa]